MTDEKGNTLNGALHKNISVVFSGGRNMLSWRKRYLQETSSNHHWKQLYSANRLKCFVLWRFNPVLEKQLPV